MLVALLFVLLIAALVAPSLLAWWSTRQLAPREGSFLTSCQELAGHRLVALIVGAVPLLVVALVGAMRPSEPDAPIMEANRYGPHYEAWRAAMMRASLFCSLVTLGILFAVAVTLVRELGLAVRVWRAAGRVAREAELSTPEGGVEPVRPDFDFGVGDERWLFWGPGNDSYREARPIVGRARGTPCVGRVVVGPLTSALALLTLFGCLGASLLLSMGD